MWCCGALDFICSPSNSVIRKFYFWIVAGFSQHTFVYSRFSTKILFLYCLLLSIYLGFQLPDKCISDTISDCRNIACTSFVWSGNNLSWKYLYYEWSPENFAIYIFENNFKLSLKISFKNFKISHATINRKLIKQYQQITPFMC